MFDLASIRGDQSCREAGTFRGGEGSAAGVIFGLPVIGGVGSESKRLGRNTVGNIVLHLRVIGLPSREATGH